MKKIILVRAEPVKVLKAVLGCDGDGYFLSQSGGSRWIGPNGIVGDHSTSTLTDLLIQDKDRQPIYIGDSITITF